MSFKQYQAQHNQQIQIQEEISVLLYLQENIDNLNEVELQEGVNDWLDKVGLKLHKGKGIINYVKQFGTSIGKMILAALKGDKAKVKEYAKEFDRAEVVDFLLKLDMATLHIITGPIHFIDAVTGWDLMSNLKHIAKGTKEILQQIWQAIQNIKNKVVQVIKTPEVGVVMNNLKNIEMSIPQA